jgi:hypothetical protein
MTTSARRGATAVTTLLVLAASVGACRDGASDAGAAGSSASSRSSAPPAVQTVVTVGRVTGTLPREARRRLAHQIGGVVDGWMDAAYVGGDYPRRDFADSWPGFTAGARDRARRDRDLMSNADIGERIEGVEAKRRRVTVDVLAVKRHPVGVTARVLLGFRTTGDVERKVRVQGRLYLTRGRDGWRVFGYDITKGSGR